MSDPERFLNPAEIELESELGPPRDPVTPPGVNPGEEGERDVVTLPSGLSYADVELGRGEPLKVADLVVAHVVGASRTVPSSRTRTGEARRSLSPSACARRACARAWRRASRTCARAGGDSSPSRRRSGSGTRFERRWDACRRERRCGTRCSCSDAYRRGKGARRREREYAAPTKSIRAIRCARLRRGEQRRPTASIKRKDARARSVERLAVSR